MGCLVPVANAHRSDQRLQGLSRSRSPMAARMQAAGLAILLKTATRVRGLREGPMLEVLDCRSRAAMLAEQRRYSERAVAWGRTEEGRAALK